MFQVLRSPLWIARVRRGRQTDWWPHSPISLIVAGTCVSWWNCPHTLLPPATWRFWRPRPSWILIGSCPNSRRPPTGRSWTTLTSLETPFLVTRISMYWRRSFSCPRAVWSSTRPRSPARSWDVSRRQAIAPHLCNSPQTYLLARTKGDNSTC